MFVSVAKRIVSVALIATAIPALANPGDFSPSINPAVYTSRQYENANGGMGYWMSSSEYYLLDRSAVHAVDAGSRGGFRRILISGYHPVRGFAPEIVKEAANATR